MNRFKELREKKNLTQSQFADRIGVSRSVVSMWERGERYPGREAEEIIADFYNVSIAYLRGQTEDKGRITQIVRIPLVGRVPAGVPIATAEDIIGYEEISHRMADQGEHFALKVQGESMEPDIKDGDVLIVRKQQNFDNGDICVVMVNGYEATVKQVKKTHAGLELIAYNPLAYSTTTYTPYEIESLPVHIIGKVIEIRRTL